MARSDRGRAWPVPRGPRPFVVTWRVARASPHSCLRARAAALGAHRSSRLFLRREGSVMANRLEITGVLSPWAPGFSTRLRVRGYAETSIYQIERVAVELDAWMATQGLEVGGLSVEVLERFVLARRVGGA